MKRYRFNSPNQTLFAKYSKYLYFFAAWNVLGMVLFAKVSTKVQTENPEYDKLSKRTICKTFFEHIVIFFLPCQFKVKFSGHPVN